MEQCRLLFFIGALKDAGAGRVTGVVPYLCYARKDRRSQPRDPITTKYVARMFKASGVDAVMTFDVHNRAAFENAFRVPAAKCREAGASRVFAAATHGLFMGDALTVLGGTGFDGIVVADTVLSAAEAAGLLPENVTMLDSSRLVGEAIALAHTGI